MLNTTPNPTAERHTTTQPPRPVLQVLHNQPTRSPVETCGNLLTSPSNPVNTAHYTIIQNVSPSQKPQKQADLTQLTRPILSIGSSVGMSQPERSPIIPRPCIKGCRDPPTLYLTQKAPINPENPPKSPNPRTQRVIPFPTLNPRYVTAILRYCVTASRPELTHRLSPAQPQLPTATRTLST